MSTFWRSIAAVLILPTVALAVFFSQPATSPPTTPGKNTMSTATTPPIHPAPVPFRYSASGYDITPLSQDRIKELARGLSEEEARVLLRKGTEPAFCGNLVDNKKQGVYLCRLCGLPLFASDSKFDSGTGWPSFFRPFDPAHVRTQRDSSHGMARTEILCARCDGHLGHVFDDAPGTPTGLRYCLNSASLTFHEDAAPLPEASRPVKTETAYFAGGCFWGVEDHLAQVPGVIDAASGYMGGRTPNPTYKEVCGKGTGHAETVRVLYDPARVSYAQLLEWFFRIHDPTQLNRQGPDVGDQYRSAIFAVGPAQLRAAQDFIKRQQESSPRFKDRRIVTQVLPAEQAGTFYLAEDYHQDYHAKHGGSCPLPER
ncbi:MAG TPA: bifunctional methionine sulfoxide reductase B/A protein [Phycisphaerales bacterium]|nr:bifunctional methionine sulfoxide reductase B/A protein [Phycisphaerales bacterium]